MTFFYQNLLDFKHNKKLIYQLPKFKKWINHFIYKNKDLWMKEDEIQSNMIKINNDILSTVKICYYENMNDEWKLICENNNLPYDKLKIKNPRSIVENHHISKMNMLKIKNINML